MKKIISILLLFISTLIVAQLPTDKKDHLIAGTLIGFTASTITINTRPIVSFAISTGSAVVIGGSKELVYDKWMGKGTPEWSDVGYTVLGSTIGYGMVQGFKGMCRLIDRRHKRMLLQIN